MATSRAPLLWLSALLGVGVSSCAPVVRPELPPSRAPDSPSALLPTDLDAAVRVDLGQLGGSLGKNVATRITLETLTAGESSAERALLGRALDHSDLLWVGWRSNEEGSTLGKVLISRGQFSWLRSESSAPDPLWSEVGGPGAPEHYVRQHSVPGAFDVLYPLGEQWLVWASPSEAPSLERRLVAGAARDRLQPPERGTLSVAASPERLRARYGPRFPALDQHFVGAERLTTYVDVGERGLKAWGELEFATAAQALDASSVVTQLFEHLGRNPCVLGVLARAAHVDVFEASLRVDAELEAGQVDGLWACILGRACCA
jgi:hypothetical protein